MTRHSHRRAGARFTLPAIPERRRFKALFSGPPAPPTPPAPVPMPDLQDPAVLAASQKAMQDAQARSGRASTILSGGNDYSGTKLGTA